jgi:hypothetical protein
MTGMIRGWAGAALVLAAALSAAPLEAQTRGRTVVVGQVVDAESQAPLNGAVVRVTGSWRQAVTGPDGSFRIAVPPGSVGVTITRLGYHGMIQTWEVAEGSGDVGIIALGRDAVLLDALEVTVDRLERERRMVPLSSRTFGIEELARSAAWNAADFVRMRGGAMVTSCGGSSWDRDCVYTRGSVIPVCVMIDDAPAYGGLTVLQGYQARDFARMHVYRGGTFIQAYTPEYISRLATSGRRPSSASFDMMAYCRNSV